MQIYVLNRARETLATTSGIYDDKHTLTLDAGSSSYEFKISKNDEASRYMDSGNYIVLQNDGGKTWLFTILDYEETQYTKTVYAEDAGIELLNKACDIWKANGPHSFEYYFNLVTSGTPWKLGVNQLAGLERTLTYEGRDTGLGRLLSILKGFDNAECTFDVTVKMNAPSDFKINVYKQVGSDRSDVQMVYSHELDDIVKKESRAEFVTALCGVGGTIQTEDGQGNTQDAGNIDFADLEYNKDGLVTTKGDKFLRAVDANKRFNPGQATYIEAFYEYDTQSASELLNRTITRLKTYSEPQYTYTADVKIIDSTLKIGDTVTIIDHDYNPALYLSARVAKLEKSYTDPSKNAIEFCNYRLLSSRLADKLARLQTVVNKLPSASQVGKLESNVSDLSKKQEELASQITSANGKNTNYYGKTEPATPKNGDLWYKKLENGEIEMYQYQDGVWQLLASTADLTTAQTELDQAKADMAQAKTDAQTAYDEAVKATGTANGAKAQTDEALKQAKQANDSYTALAKEVADNKTSTDADYKQAQADIAQAQKDLASVTDTVTEVKKGQGELSTKIAGKVDNTIYQTYVTQTNKALSEKLVASDLNGYAKTVDVKHTTDGLSASITKLQGNLAYQATELIGKKSFEDGNVGDWTCNDCKTKAAISGITSYSAYGYHKCIYAPNNNDLCWNVDYKVNPGDKYYVELLAPNFYSVHGGRTITVNAYFKYIKDGKNAWQMGPSGQVVTGTSGWIKGIVTVPDNVTSVKPWISVKDNGVASAAYLTYASFTKLDDYTQSQLNTLSGKITATSDRLSSVYTKSETDTKLKTKVEQSALTQTSNNLSASIAKNSKILSSAGLVNENAYINANKIALNGKTLMTNATINDAFVGNLSANKITTGTLNAAKVNLINVNASNISTGTLSGVKITSTGKDPSGTSSTTNIQSGYIDTNVINCSDYILVGKADADPRKRWQTKQTPQGMWFQTPAKITGHTGNAVSDWQTEWQGFMGGDGWNYRNTTVTGTGYSGIQLALTPQQEWGNPYGGDMMSFGTWIRTETSNKTKNILDGTLDPFLWYSYTGQSAAYKDTVVIPKPLRVFGETHFDWDIHVKGGGSHGIRTAWVSWSDWGSNQKIPCIVNDTNNWGGIAFPSNGRVVLFTHGYRINTDGLPKDKAGCYNGWGS